MRQVLLAATLLAGCGRAEPDPLPPPVPKTSIQPPLEIAEVTPKIEAVKPAETPAVQEETPIIRRSHHWEGEALESFRVEVDLKDPGDHGLIVFVDAPENLEKRLTEYFKDEKRKKLRAVPGGGEATLYLLWPGKKGGLGPNDLANVSIDREHHVVRVSFTSAISAKVFERQKGESTVGLGVRLGPLERGSWTIAVQSIGDSGTWTSFLAGPGGPEPERKIVPVERKKEAELPAFLITWPSVDPDHPLTVFVCREEEFETALAARLGAPEGREPAPFKPSDELVLYVLWGSRMGWPEAVATFDAKARKVTVSSLWTGTPMMKSSHESRYAAYGFTLGRREPGDYFVDVIETSAAFPDRPKTTRQLKFSVGR